MSEQLPKHAQVVIIGGGIIGCSTAYHLTKIGWKDVVLLERKELASGTTWAAAGLVTQLRVNRQLSDLAKYATQLYPSLEAETGVATGYVKTGSITVCRDEERRLEWTRAAATAKAFGIEAHEIGAAEAKRMLPGLFVDDLASAFYIPEDGQTNPEDTTQALAKGARNNGARIFQNTKVTDIKVKDGAVTGVSTEKGDIACEVVVNCAGMWGRHIGSLVNVSIPLHAAEHMHAVTLPIEGFPEVFPSVRDFDGYSYFKSEMGGILFGLFEPVAKPWGMKGIPEEFKFTQLQEDYDQFELCMECAFTRFPDIQDAEVRHLEVVPESFTPDTAFNIGEVPGVKNFFVGCGMNSVGIASAAGAGFALAQIIDQGYPEYELWPLDVKRWFPWQRNKKYLHDRIKESVGVLYHHHYPNRQKETARPVICTPIHDRLKEKGACFSMIAGWERADWFAPEGVEPKHEYSWHRQNWFPYQAEEHMAVRDGVGMYDLSSMGKFLVQGRDAEAALQGICANDVAVPVGQVVYTPILNERGGFETDVTVTKIAENTFFIVTAAATTIHDLDYIRRLIPTDAVATITDVTHGYAMLAVMGPKSRDLLARLTDDDLSNDGFPYATAREIDIAYARPLAMRMSYVGELGWELYIPTNFVQGVFDAIMEAGAEFGLRLVGMQAVNSLRLECGFRHWESDITPDETPYEAGLSFGVKLDKGEFIGREALLKAKDAPLKQKLVMFTLNDPEPLLYFNEPIFRNGEHVGEICSGAYGHKVGSAVGMGYVRNQDGVTNAWVKEGTYEVKVEGKMIPATVHLKSPYDPDNQRTKM